jgi:hypothetical protein
MLIDFDEEIAVLLPEEKQGLMRRMLAADNWYVSLDPNDKVISGSDPGGVCFWCDLDEFLDLVDIMGNN